jgi:hypothetical protein
VVVAQTRADPAYLVGRHRSPNAAAANDDPAVEISGRHGVCQGNDEVGVVVAGLERRRAEVLDAVPCRLQPGLELLLHVEAAVVGGDCDFH